MTKTFEDFSLNESLYPPPRYGEKKRYLINKDDSSELILMIWGPGSLSPIHDHAGSECWTTILKGQLLERTFSKSPMTFLDEQIIMTGTISHIDKDEGVHQLLNSSHEPAYSLHLYKKPLAHCSVFDPDKEVWSVLENYYDNELEAVL